MHIEQELHHWLSTNIPDKRKEKRRDISIVLNYYGFGDLPWPTFEKIAQQMSVGTRERVRQIINSSFRDLAREIDFPVARTTFDVIESREFFAVPDLRASLISRGLASDGTTVRGVLNLARDFDRCEGYSLYDSSLEKIARSEAEFDSSTFLIHENYVSSLKTGLKKARTLPGLLGLSRFQYLRSELGSTNEAERVLSFVKESSKAVSVRRGDSHWYIFEDRDNTLLNCCEKIFDITDLVDIGVLASTLQNSLRRRSHRYAYPETDVIVDWIESSRWFNVNGNVAQFLGQKRDLTEIEQATVEYLDGVDYSLYPPLKDHLLSLGYSKPSADKAITTSPLVTVDKSGPRKTYTYTLISKAGYVGEQSPQNTNRYQDFKNRLRSLLATGTDTAVEALARREQSILREWLLDDEVEANCAICGGQYSVSALVTAHKKRRSACNESERVDPYVVFPLCVFGCDFLYGTGAIRVVDGSVAVGALPEASTQDVLRAHELSGKRLEEKWLLGDSQYFERNLTSQFSRPPTAAAD